MILVRRATPADAAAMGAVHVATWRNTYPGILPEEYLTRLSPTRIARQYGAAIAAGRITHVACPAQGSSPAPRLIGFCTAGEARHPALGDGEIETLYVLDDWRDQGAGRRLLAAAGADLAARMCRSAYLWVLRDNPSRFFYQHLGGASVMEGVTRVAGQILPQVAYRWQPIDRLIAAEAAKEK